MKLTKRSKTLLIVFAGALLLIAAFFSWKLYRDAHPESYSTFQPYIPTKIVDNLNITEKNLEIWENHALLSFSPSNIVIRLKLNHEHSYITETKNRSQGDLFCNAQNTQCEKKVTPKGQTYTLRRTYAQADASPKLVSDEIIFNRDEVRIAVNISSKNNTPITDEDWSAMIDSFEPTPITDFRVKHMRPGP